MNNGFFFSIAQSTEWWFNYIEIVSYNLLCDFCGQYGIEPSFLSDIKCPERYKMVGFTSQVENIDGLFPKYVDSLNVELFLFSSVV